MGNKRTGRGGGMTRAQAEDVACALNLNGRCFKSPPGAAGEPAFRGVWVDFGAPREVLAFRKTPFGDVQIRGVVKNGGNITVVFTLPAGYRPANERAFPNITGGAGANNGSILVAADGTATATSGAGTNANVSMEARSTCEGRGSLRHAADRKAGHA